MPLKFKQVNRRKTRVLYVDLDGTIRKGLDELGRFVNGPEDVELFDGVADRLLRYRTAGWRIIAITNQGGVALGHTTFERAMLACARTNDLAKRSFDKIVMCRHHPAAKDPEYAVCWCRKPRIGGLVEAALSLADACREYYPPHLSLFVGDRDEDRQCAENAGVPFMLASEWRDHGEP